MATERGPNIKWDSPATEVFGPSAPEGLKAWQHAYNIGYSRAARLLDRTVITVRTAVRNPKRHGYDARSRTFRYKPGYNEAQPEPEVQSEPSPGAPEVFVSAPKIASLHELSAEVRRQFPGGVPDKEWHQYWEDPVVWAAECKPYIESKEAGLIPFDPDDVQKMVMRYFWEGGIYIVEKSRQRRISTPLVLAGCHKLLYAEKVLGQPLHMHIVGDKRETAKDVLLQMAKVALSTALLTDEERECLSGQDMTAGAERIRYFTSMANNYMQSHTSTRSSGRSYPGNAALLEEFAYMRDAEGVWKSVAPMVEGVTNASLWVVSTPDHEATYHAHLCENAELYGAIYLPIDWRGHPGRDEEWKRREKQKLGALEFGKEHELKRIGTGSPVLNMETLRRAARKVRVLPRRPVPGHRYAKGVDIGGDGRRDKTVLTVLDITYKPAVVVYCEAIEDGKSAVSTETRKRVIEEFDALWPGKMFVDCTGNRDFVNLIVSRNKVPVHFSFGEEEKMHLDKGERMMVKIASAQKMFSALALSLDTGTVVVHEKRHPDLWRGLAGARHPKGMQQPDGSLIMQSAAKRKRQGPNPDFVDSLMLARLGMGRTKDVAAQPTATREERERRLRDDEGWRQRQEEDGRRFREVHVPGPMDKLREAKW